jgi:hypothetical protein
VRSRSNAPPRWIEPRARREKERKRERERGKGRRQSAVEETGEKSNGSDGRQPRIADVAAAGMRIA